MRSVLFFTLLFLLFLTPELSKAQEFFICNQGGEIGKMNIADCSFKKLSIQNAIDFSDIAYSPNGKLYGIQFNNLYEIDTLPNSSPKLVAQLPEGGLSQCAAGLASCYSYEDLPSNRFGGESADALKTPRGLFTSYRRGEDLFNTLQNIFDDAEATAPEAAPNFNRLPMRERLKLPDGETETPVNGGRQTRYNYTEEEKAAAMKTGLFVPQNFTDRPMDLNNFPAPAKRYALSYSPKPLPN